MGRKVFATTLFAAAASSMPTISVGQATSPNAVLGEIIVTATRRAEPLQNIPESIRAITGGELQLLGADSLQGFANFVPGLQLIDRGPGLTQIVMRGVTTGEVRFDLSEVRETVGLYIDETPVSVQRFSPNVALFDLDRIEVLRGPQPVLYGAGSLSGTIRLIMNKPDSSDWAGKVEAGADYIEDGGWGSTIRAMLNAPLATDTAALRVVAFNRDGSGFVDNSTRGGDDINDVEHRGGRVALRLTPNERFTVDATVLYDDLFVADNGSFKPVLGDLQTDTTIPEFTDGDSLVVGLVIDIEFGGATFTSSSSYLTKDMRFDVDAGAISDIFTGGDDIPGSGISRSEQEEYSQEFRLVSSAESRIGWVVGALYQNQDNDFFQDLPIEGIDAILAGLGIPPSSFFGAPDDNLFNSDIRIKTEQIAVFGEVTVPLGDRFSATAGGRWFEADQDATVDLNGLFAVPALDRESFSAKEDGFNPTVTLSYQLREDKLLYAQAARGFRLGGTNEPLPLPACQADLDALGLTEPPTSFAADNLWEYELGAKTSWADKRVILNASVYYIDWKDAPVTAPSTCGFSFVVNAGNLEVRGAELELQAQLTPALVASMGLGYVDSELAEDSALLGANEGDDAPFTPPFTASATLDYTFPIFGSREGFLHANYQFVDKRSQAFGDPADPNLRLSSYGVAGMRAGVILDHWRIEGYVSNITDERAEINKANRAFAEIPGLFLFTNQPRTYGFTLTASF